MLAHNKEENEVGIFIATGPNIKSGKLGEEIQVSKIRSMIEKILGITKDYPDTFWDDHLILPKPIPRKTTNHSRGGGNIEQQAERSHTPNTRGPHSAPNNQKKSNSSPKTNERQKKNKKPNRLHGLFSALNLTSKKKRK